MIGLGGLVDDMLNSQSREDDITSFREPVSHSYIFIVSDACVTVTQGFRI